MKKLFLFFAISVFCTLSAAPGKALVVYFSWSDSGNTRQLARIIAANTNADLEELIPVTPYSRNYKEVLIRGKKELKSTKASPVKALKHDLSKYDIIFVGTPIWFATFAPPVRSFLQQNDLKGKKVYFFCTHGKGGAGHFFKDAAQYSPGAKIGRNFSCYGIQVKKIDPKVKEWLKKNVKQ